MLEDNHFTERVTAVREALAACTLNQIAPVSTFNAYQLSNLLISSLNHTVKRREVATDEFLFNKCTSLSKKESTCRTVPKVVKTGMGFLSFPSAPTTFEILNVTRMRAMASRIYLSA